MSLSLSNLLRVRVGAEQPLQFFRVLALHLDHPTFAVGIAVHERRISLERLIGFDDRAGDRAVQLRHRLDRLDRAEDVVLLELRRRLGQLDEDDVAQLALCIVRDADLYDLRVGALSHPLMVLRKAEFFGDAGHGTGAYNRSARGASPAPSSSLSDTRVSPQGRKSRRTAIGSGSGDK